MKCPVEPCTFPAQTRTPNFLRPRPASDRHRPNEIHRTTFSVDVPPPLRNLARWANGRAHKTFITTCGTGYSLSRAVKKITDVMDSDRNCFCVTYKGAYLVYTAAVYFQLRLL